MKKILTKVFVLTAAAIVLAGTVPQGVNAQANRHHCKRKMVTVRHASCYQDGYCNLNGSCDVNGVCQNGGYCFGAHCSQNGICDQTNCPLGTDCPNYLGGNYNGSGTAASGTVSPSVTPQEDNNANNAPAADTAPVAPPQADNNVNNTPEEDTAPVAPPQVDDNNSEDVYPVEEVSPAAPPQETVISPDPVVYPDNDYNNGYCDTPGSCWNGTDYNDYTHHPEGNNNGWSGHHSGRGHGSHH